MDVTLVVLGVARGVVGLHGVVFVFACDFQSIWCPVRILVPLLGTLYVFFFLMQHLWVGTDSPIRVCKSVEYTILSRKVMVVVPMKVLVCADRFPVDSCKKCVVRSW